MQAAFCITAPSALSFPPYKNSSHFIIPPSTTRISPASRLSCTKTTAAYDTSTVDYSSTISVFPAEACETLGGDACSADIYPEVKLNPDARNSVERAVGSELVDREYLEYDDAKTVFCAEACDDLGGEFCSSEYQRGVY